ncbi:uncharacterized mitochondrial protein-like protein [Tanacetum coccineum]
MLDYEGLLEGFEDTGRKLRLMAIDTICSQEIRQQEQGNSRRECWLVEKLLPNLCNVIGLGGYDWSDQAEEGPNYALMAYSSSSSDSELIECLDYDNFKKGIAMKNYNASPPPYTMEFLCLHTWLSFTGLDEFVNKLVVENRKSDEEVSKVVRKSDDSPIIEDWVSDSLRRKFLRFSYDPTSDAILHRSYTILSGGHVRSYDLTRKLASLTALLNTIDHLGKFDGKADEGFFVGYSLNSKAFRVFNSRTRIVEENLHIRFSESTPNIVGSGPDWLFDIDALTRIMNYKPIVAGTQSNGFAGTKASDNACQARKEIEPVKDYILLPLWTADPPFSQDPKSSHDDGFKPSSDDEKKVDEDPRKDNECNDQEKEDNVNSTNNVNAASTNEVNVVGRKTSIELPYDPNMPALEDDSIFDFTRDDEDDGFEDPDFPDRVYKVEKAMYGLHQAPRAWYKTLSTYMLDNFKEGKLTRPYSSKGTKDEDGEEVDVHMYRSMIGSLMYLTSSRPDIMFAVCACARYQVNPKSTVKVKTINGEAQLHALIDGKKIIITEASVRRDLQLADEEGVECLLNSTIFEQLALMGPKTTAWNEFSSNMASAIICLATNQKFNFSKFIFESEGSAIPTDPHHTPTIIQSSTQPQKTQKPRKPKRKDTQVPQSSDPIKNVADEVVHKELGDSLVRAATAASSLEAEQDSNNINKTRSKATPNESSSLGTTSGGGLRCRETMGDTISQTRFESISKHFNDSLLARGNTLQSDEDRLKLDELMALYTTLQNRVLDLEKTKITQHNEIASLKKRVKKLENKSEDASKQGRINAIDADEEITLVSVQNVDEEMFDVNVLDGEEVFVVEQEVANEKDDDGEITLAQALIEMKSTKPKVKGVIIQEPEPMKKKDLISLDEETTLKLQAEFDEKERLAREKAKKEKEANIALIETWDDIHAKIDVDHQLAERLQAQEQEELSIKEKATLFQQLLEKRRKHFAAKRAEEKRNKPPTKAQQKKIMCNYLKNMEGYKLKDLKLKEFDSIQKMFDRAFQRVNTFEDFRTELVEGKEKRAGTELIQENAKKQKVEDDKETTELKHLMKIIPDEEEVTIDAIPLAVKSPSIEVNLCAKIQSRKTKNSNKPIEQKSHTQKPVRKIFIEHGFSPNNTSVMYEKRSPKSDLRWKPTGRIFKTVGLRWVPTRKILASYTSKDDSEPTYGSNVDISKIHECKQTMDLSACTSINVQKEQIFDLNTGTSYNVKYDNLRVWLLKKLISQKPVL